LQQALAFGSQTVFSISNTTVTLVNSPGFYRVTGNVSFGSAAGTASVGMTDGVSGKAVLGFNNSTTTGYNQDFDLIFWLAAGESIEVGTSAATIVFAGSFRQVGDPEGNLVQPSGYPL